MLTIGHRGAAGNEPENTIQSFKKAVDIGVDMIEFDIQLCKSGEVVVIHDFTLERTTNGIGYVTETSLSDIKKLNAGKGQQIPTLEEALNTINRNTEVNIELKGNNIARATATLIRSFIENKNWQTDDFLVSSFNHSELLAFKKLMPEIRIGVLFEEIPDGFNETASALKAFSINAEFNYLTKKNVNHIHSLGYKVFAYTVNSKDDKLRMKQMGVDGIFTDFPDKLMGH